MPMPSKWIQIDGKVIIHIITVATVRVLSEL